jgi:tetratricopeptide (TPR) repeat protein
MSAPDAHSIGSYVSDLYGSSSSGGAKPRGRAALGAAFLAYCWPVVVVALAAIAISAARIAGYPKRAVYLIIALSLLAVCVGQGLAVLGAIARWPAAVSRRDRVGLGIATTCSVLLAVFAVNFWENRNLFSSSLRSIASWQTGPVRVIVVRDGRLDLGASYALTELQPGTPRLVEIAAAQWLRSPLLPERLVDGKTLLISLRRGDNIVVARYLDAANGHVTDALRREYITRDVDVMDRGQLHRLLRLTLVDADRQIDKRPLLLSSSMSDESFAEFSRAVNLVVMTSPERIAEGIEALRKASTKDPEARAVRVELAHALGVAMSRGWIEQLSVVDPAPQVPSTESPDVEHAAALLREAFEHASYSVRSDDRDERAWKALGTTYKAALACRRLMGARVDSSVESLLCESQSLFPETRVSDEQDPERCLSGLAVSAFEHAVSIDSGCFSAWSNLTAMYASLRRLEDMNRCYTFAKGLVPDSPVPLLNAATYYLAMARDEAAVEKRSMLLVTGLAYIDAGIAENDQIGIAYYNRACARLIGMEVGVATESGYEDVVRDLETALKLGDVNYSRLLRTDSDLRAFRVVRVGDYGRLLDSADSEAAARSGADDWLVNM